MPEPHIEVLGVYRLDVTDELFQEQFDILYGTEVPPDQRTEAGHQIREQLVPRPG